mgnify:CR=1 FL=1|jgi:hypothetical protein
MALWSEVQLVFLAGDEDEQWKWGGFKLLLLLEMYLLLDLNILGMLQIGNTSSTFSLSLFRGHFFNSIYFTYDSVMFAFFSNPMYVLSWLCSDLFFIRE